MELARHYELSAASSGISEVCGGAIYALGGQVQAGPMCSSWIPHSVHGWIPFQCYVLKDAGDLVMLDGGLPIFKESIRAGLKVLARDSHLRQFLMTRRELDTILNLPWIAQEFEFQSIRCGGDLNPIDFFALMDDAALDVQIRSLVSLPFEFLRPGEVIRVGSLSLEMIRASLMVLPTFWFYEAATRTLFTSDFWTFVSQENATEGPIKRVAPEDVTAARILESLDVKFDWLRGIDCSGLISELEAIFKDRVVDRLCPNFGCVIEGRDAVRRVVSETVCALHDLAGYRRPSVMSVLRKY
jgi:hypothetical protein